MSRYLAIVTLLLVLRNRVLCGHSPLRVTIDCGTRENNVLAKSAELLDRDSRFDVTSFCELFYNAIPKAVKDGKFVVESAEDQTAYSDTQILRAVTPPKTLIPNLGLRKLKSPKLRIPKINVPQLGLPTHGPLKAPSVGSAMSFPSFKDIKIIEDESSAERMEKFKKGVQRMLHVVKVLGQIDQYLSERTRIVVDKLSKTFAD